MEVNMNPKLKECPFCGSKSAWQAMMPGMMTVVGCDRCGCRTKEYAFPLDAVSAWNRRIASDEEPSNEEVKLAADELKELVTAYKEVNDFTSCDAGV